MASASAATANDHSSFPDVKLPSKLEIPGGPEQVINVCKRRFFFAPAFEIYNGVSGLYDYGPVMAAIKSNFLELWKKHFVIAEGMVFVEPTCVTPEAVFVTSGHVERFNDVAAKDVKTGAVVRLDKHVETVCDQRLAKEKDAAKRQRLEVVQATVDGMKAEDMWKVVKELDIKSPQGNELSEPFQINLMFPTTIGPEGTAKGYLRPEIAQGIFMNFKRMLEFNQGKMPFAGASIGTAFRNEIAPRGGLLRVREFVLAEIEHFMHPKHPEHEKFHLVKDIVLPLYSRERQQTEPPQGPFEMTVGEAVQRGIIGNESLGYFMARTYIFMQRLGLRFIRFRQHRSNEMAHYARDCWDCELLNKDGWLECVGLADRSCFDLTRHSERTGQKLEAFERYDAPREVEIVQRTPVKKEIMKKFKGDGNAIVKYFETITDEEALALQDTLAKGPAKINVEGKEFEVTADLVAFAKATQKVDGEAYVPQVVEPSFGIGRIIWCLLEQSFYIVETSEKEEGEDAAKDKTQSQRVGFRLPAVIAPFKVMVCPVVTKDKELLTHVAEIAQDFAENGIAYKVDDSGITIGRRYARTDELGVPLCATVDGITKTENTVTIRDRDSREQVRVPKAELSHFVERMCTGRLTWEQAKQQYPVVGQAAAE